MADGRCLGDVEREKLIVIEMARKQSLQMTPSTEQGNCGKRTPGMSVNEASDGQQEPNRQQRTGTRFGVCSDRFEFGNRAHIMW